MTSFRKLMESFPDENACREYLFNRRWPDGHPSCPRCGKPDFVYNINQAWKWECSNKDCRRGNAYRFSLISGTIFENTKYPLTIWFQVLWAIVQSKKGISSLQLRRMFFEETTSLRTAWYMSHRLRAAMYNEDFRQLMGIVEIDETYIGGKQEKRHWKQRRKYHGGGPAHTGKVTVIGPISRKGNVTCKIIENTSQRTIFNLVSKLVSDKVDLLATDSAANLQMLRLAFPHQTVDHKAGEYVRGVVHTNNIESFWALLKRGVLGTFHNVSRKYLPLYLAEFQFRHNNRKNPDIFGEAVAGC
jgi:transposase-like protein